MTIELCSVAEIEHGKFGTFGEVNVASFVAPTSLFSTLLQFKETNRTFVGEVFSFNLRPLTT